LGPHVTTRTDEARRFAFGEDLEVGRTGRADAGPHHDPLLNRRVHACAQHGACFGRGDHRRVEVEIRVDGIADGEKPSFDRSSPGLELGRCFRISGERGLSRNSNVQRRATDARRVSTSDVRVRFTIATQAGIRVRSGRASCPRPGVGRRGCIAVHGACTTA
jgi:hypothetical protein